MKELIVYVHNNGNAPFQEWLQSFRKNLPVQARILDRVERLKIPHYGDYKHVGNGVLELRLHFGSGYRIYFAEDGKRIVLLLCGGDKSSQKKDIANAKAYWQEYQQR